LGSGGIAPGINLGARWKSVVSFMTPTSSSCQNSFDQTTAKNENSTFNNWKWQKIYHSYYRWSNQLPNNDTVKVRSFGLLSNVNWIDTRYISQDLNFQQHHCENLISRTWLSVMALVVSAHSQH
jgi:hypothetical protein